ncbi:MAG: DUF6514 family protein [Eubacteriales bacterium]
MYLEGVRKVTVEKNKKLEMQYYITELDHYIADHLTQIYGIEIINKVDEKGGTYYEKECVTNLSFSKDYVQRLINILMNNLVTPVCMIEIIDELMNDSQLAG